MLNFNPPKHPKPGFWKTEEGRKQSLEYRDVWKAKKIEDDKPRIQIKKTFPHEDGSSSDFVIIVGIDGIRYKHHDNKKNISISANGPIHLTFEEFGDVCAAIEEAKMILVQDDMLKNI